MDSLNCNGPINGQSQTHSASNFERPHQATAYAHQATAYDSLSCLSCRVSEQPPFDLYSAIIELVSLFFEKKEKPKALITSDTMEIGIKK